METKKSKLPIIIVIVIIAFCVGIFAAGLGGYYLFSNFFGITSTETITQEPIVEEVIPTDDLPLGELFPKDNDQPTQTAEQGDPTAPPNLSSLFAAFWRTRELLHDNFLEQPVDDSILAEGAIQGIHQYLEEQEISTKEIQTQDISPTQQDLAKESETPKDAQKDFLSFWSEWAKLYHIEFSEEMTWTALMRSALSGMVAALDDPYTNYFDPDLAEQWNTELSGEYEGIGAWVEVENEYLTIISPIKNTPAEDVGLQPGDQIIAIDGDDMTGVDPNIALKRVLGPAGTKVTLTILREGVDEPFDVEIIRRKIVIPYIEYEILPGDIAYLKLIRFYEGGDQEFRIALEDLLSEDPKGLIIDLRRNPGGFLHIVVNITSEFLTEGNVLIEEFSDGSQKTYPVISSRGIAPDIPLVVLVDEGSASASEIFAGAIQDYDRGTIIGTTTFGKGLVQLPITLPDDQGLVSITVARWLTPNEDTIHDIGIEPDIVVEPSEEEIANDLDPQLDEAVRILSSN